MFRFTERLSSGTSGARESRRYLKRAGLFAAGLVLLWLALQLVPSPQLSDPAVYADESGAVAANRPLPTRPTGPDFLSLGNIAAILVLVGGGAVAYYLHRRARHGGSAPSAIQSLGELVIGQNQQLRLVKCGEEILLLGVTTGQINLLRTYEAEGFAHYQESEASSEFHTVRAAPAFRSTHFADVLRQHAGRYMGPNQNGKLC